MISFFYDKPNKVVYLYHAGLEVAKLWDVFKIEKDNATGFYLLYCTDNNGGMIMGTQLDAKI